MKSKTMMIILAAGVIGLAGFYFYYQGDESRIRRQFSRLAEWGSKPSGETALSAGVRIKKLETLFEDACRVDAPEYSRSKTYTRSEIGNIARAAAGRYRAVDLRFFDLTVSVAHQTAAVVCTVKIHGAPVEGEAFDNVHELECVLEQRGKQWLVEEIRLVDVLEK